MKTGRTQYAFGLGANLALASLMNLENTLNGFNQRYPGDSFKPIVISSPPLELYPVRDTTLDNYERGDGSVDHYWDITMCSLALKYWINTTFSNQTVITVPMTIYTLRSEFNEYDRYNALAIMPNFDSNQGDITRLGYNTYKIRQRFNNLQAAS